MGRVPIVKTNERYDEGVHIQTKNKLFKGQIKIKCKDKHQRIAVACQFQVQKSTGQWACETEEFKIANKFDQTIGFDQDYQKPKPL